MCIRDSPYMLPGTVLRNLEVCAPPAAERRALISLLEQVGLAEKKDHQARTLSGGEAQRLALARAIVTGREILILDEPTAHTDAASAIRIWDLLRALKTKKTILFSTHHRKIAETLGDRIVEIADGTIRHDWRNDCAYQSPS
ncbi:MAG: ATP-binding cassette domain-containing protein, partial [Rectinema sp.]|nr:ATP-binding cassette domain-containing protein [Rectinema sp.]